jgi:glycosyltransferase involved in cell wall biosynthesis
MMTTTRITFVTKTTVYGGTEKHLVDLVRRMDSPDVASTILCYGSDVFTQYLGEQKNVRVLSHGPIPSIPFSTCWRILRGLQPHVIVYVNGWLGLFPWYIYLAGRITLARRVIAIEHLTAAPAPPELAEAGVWNFVRRHIGWQARSLWKQRLAGLLVDRTICVSNAVRERLVDDYGYPARRTVTVLNGVDLQYFRPSGSVSEESSQVASTRGSNATTLLCIGNLWRQKRVDILLEALAIVAKGEYRCACIIVGSGPLEPELRAQSVRLGLASIVRFAGRAEDVRPYLEAADLFVLSSENEGLPLVLGEAMAYGIPCVVTDVGGNKEIVVHGETGLLVEPGSPVRFAEAIIYLLANSEERRRMGANAQRRVRQHFNIEDAMSRLREIVIGGARAKPVPPAREVSRIS